MPDLASMTAADFVIVVLIAAGWAVMAVMFSPWLLVMVPLAFAASWGLVWLDRR